MIAHRGLSGMFTENTDNAFRGAAERSYYGIETDIRRTGDGQFVLVHDDSLFRISGRNVNVESTPLEELLSVPLRDKSGSGEEIYLATPESYLAISKAAGKRCILELKSDFTEEEIARIIALCREAEYLDGVTFISFHYDDLLAVRALLPAAEVQFLTSTVNEEIVARLLADGINLSAKHTALDRATVERFHAEGLSVGTWTVDDVKIAERLRDWGVDFITTNILE